MKFSSPVTAFLFALPSASAIISIPEIDLGLLEDDPNAPKYCYDPTDDTCGPQVWEFLPFTDNQCGGQRNSPIAISSTRQCTPLTYDFYPGTCTWGDLIYNINDHSIKAEYPSTCDHPEVLIGSIVYEVAQWHVHLGQEHSIDGEFASAAVHIVHTLKSDPNGEATEPFAVVGYGLKAGTEVGINDPFLDRMIYGFGETATETASHCSLGLVTPTFFWKGVYAPFNIADPYAILPSNPTFYQYLGGLTTPPCTEAVFWNFLSDYIPVSVSQIDFINNLILNYIDPATCEKGTVADPKTGNTSRPPIDPAGRTVTRVGAC